MEAIGRLAGGIAHDFNNLLTIIQGCGEILQEQIQGPGNLKNVQRIRDAAQRASDLTQQLLAFGRRQLVCPIVIDLNQGVLRMQEMMRRLVGEDIAIRMLLADDLWNVKMDPVQMDQILLCLIANARDSMPRGGVVTLRTFNRELLDAAVGQPKLSPGQYVCLFFSDSGSGMDSQTLSHIFEPFFTTKELGQGSGLGLATVYGIVQQCGGDISAHSTPGLGTEFTIYLPRTVEPPASEHAEAQEAKQGSGKILLVEDEPGLRGMLTECIREFGYSVYEAEDAEKALEIAKKRGEGPGNRKKTAPGPADY